MGCFFWGVSENVAVPPPDGIGSTAGPVKAFGSFNAFFCLAGTPPNGVVCAGSSSGGSEICNSAKVAQRGTLGLSDCSISKSLSLSSPSSRWSSGKFGGPSAQNQRGEIKTALVMLKSGSRQKFSGVQQSLVYSLHRFSSSSEFGSSC